MMNIIKAAEFTNATLPRLSINSRTCENNYLSGLCRLLRAPRNLISRINSARRKTAIFERNNK